MGFIENFLVGFWNYVSLLAWWQGAVIIILLILLLVFNKYWKDLLFKICKKFNFLSNNVTIQYRMFWGLVNEGVNQIIKNEIRRSLKDNGFHELNDNDFVQYMKHQRIKLISMFREHLINMYPPIDNKLVVSMDDVLMFLDKIDAEIGSTIFDIYQEAKRLKKLEIQTYDEIDDNFEKDINNFIENQITDLSCKNCLTILFGKREIANIKKDRIVTLKAQMIYVESRLTDIQTKLLSYYSGLLNKK